jgi:hypothetical protein
MLMYKDGPLAYTAAAQVNTLTSVDMEEFVSIQVSGTFVATLVVEGSLDGGTTWSTIAVRDAAAVSSTTQVASITAAGLFVADVRAVPAVRIRCSAYTSGTATVNTYGELGR